MTENLERIFEIEAQLRKLKLELEELDSLLLKTIYNAIGRNELINAEEIMKRTGLNKHLVLRGLIKLKKKNLVEEFYDEDYDPSNPFFTVKWRKKPIIVKKTKFIKCSLEESRGANFCLANTLEDAIAVGMACLECPYAVLKQEVEEKWEL